MTLEIERMGPAAQRGLADRGFLRLPVLLAGGEVGILQQWHHAEDRSW
jgi:hypothetical protein